MAEYESDANPIKLGYLMDFALPEEFPEDKRLDLTQSLELIFERGYRDGRHRPSGGDRLQGGRRPAEGLGQACDRRVRRAGRRGLPRSVRAEHHRQRRTDEGGDRAPVRGPCPERHRFGGLAWTLDVRAPDGFATDEPASGSSRCSPTATRRSGP